METHINFSQRKNIFYAAHYLHPCSNHVSFVFNILKVVILALLSKTKPVVEYIADPFML